MESLKVRGLGTQPLPLKYLNFWMLYVTAFYDKIHSSYLILNKAIKCMETECIVQTQRYISSYYHVELL